MNDAASSEHRLKGTGGPVINQVVPLGWDTLIGSSPDAQVVIEGDGIAEKHAHIRVGDDGGIRVTTVGGEARVRVNGRPVVDAVLGQGDELQIGPCRWIVQSPGKRPGRVLTPEVTQPRRRAWPWLVTAAVLTAAAAAAWWAGVFERALA